MPNAVLTASDAQGGRSPNFGKFLPQVLKQNALLTATAMTAWMERRMW
jgi:hypothetical protein